MDDVNWKVFKEGVAMISVKKVSKTYKVKQQERTNNIFKNLFKCEYRSITAVDNISFEVAQGEIVGLIGLNGAGKTTTLKMLSGLIYPSEGEIKVKGFVPHKLKNDYLREIGLVMGNKSQLWWDTSSYDSFELEGQIYGLDSKTISDRVEYLSELLDVKELLRTPVRKLSLGERMKMEFILVLLHEPSILFLDEPTIGLDILSQKKMRDFLKDYNEKQCSTMLITSHNMKDVEELCDRVIVIDHGAIIYDGMVEELKKYSKEDDFEVVITKLLESREL